MATSSVPRVKAALLGVMQTAVTDLSAKGAVTYAHPGSTIQKEAVFMGDAVFESEQVAALRKAPVAQTETYTIPVYVDVCLDGNDPQTGEERMWVIVGQIETAIRNDQTLGAVSWSGGALHWAQVGGGGAGKTPRTYQSDGVRYSMCEVSVKCQARI